MYLITILRKLNPPRRLEIIISHLSPLMSSSIPLLFTLRTTQSILRGPSPFVILRSLSSSATTTSVNPTEISHFNALASTWWDPHGSSRILHLMNPLRHDFITSCLTSSSSHPTKTLAHHDDDVNNNNNNQSLDGLRYLDILMETRSSGSMTPEPLVTNHILPSSSA